MSSPSGTPRGALDAASPAPGPAAPGLGATGAGQIAEKVTASQDVDDLLSPSFTTK